ncbi:MAG: RNA polymerase factor sigma-32 [Deltaproteobacteria bacterium]|nr:RNA polymerase factor sigma-32 [Deltaproteobacteria bacterium]
MTAKRAKKPASPRETEDLPVREESPPDEVEVLDSEEDGDLGADLPDAAGEDLTSEEEEDEEGNSLPVLVGEEAQGQPPAPVNALQRYLWEARQYPLLSREEEERLAKRFLESGDPDAAAKLVTSNLRLVVKIAMDHQRYWMRNLLDLIQEGNVGLLQAVKKFDPFRGIKFSYYASFWIKAYILKFIMDNWRLVRLGTTQAQRKLFYKLRQEKEKLLAQGISPEPRLLSDNLGVPIRDVVEMEQRLDSWELSLDAPVREESDEPHQSFMPDDKLSAEEDLASMELRDLFHEQLMAFRETLDDKEKDILDRRLLAENPETLNDLGDTHGVSRERIRQIQVRLMEKLRDFMRERIPDFEAQFIDLVEGD